MLVIYNDVHVEKTGWSANITAAREIHQGLSQRSHSRCGTAGSQLVDVNRR